MADYPQQLPSLTVSTQARRVVVACSNCRQRRVKCITKEGSPDSPCERCRKKDLVCEYMPVRSPHTPQGRSPGSANNHPSGNITSRSPAPQNPSHYGRGGYPNMNAANHPQYSGVMIPPAPSANPVPSGSQFYPNPTYHPFAPTPNNSSYPQTPYYNQNPASYFPSPPAPPAAASAEYNYSNMANFDAAGYQAANQPK
ncbi:hypothetical protein C8J57DRAFT_1492530 [Mycena rebaudengoi]|nr:hypothetical protein C8J57DRAFT_1492530 [Mycena rebaudengoi]